MNDGSRATSRAPAANGLHLFNVDAFSQQLQSLAMDGQAFTFSRQASNRSRRISIYSVHIVVVPHERRTYTTTQLLPATG